MSTTKTTSEGHVVPKKVYVTKFDIYELAAHMTGTTEAYEENGGEEIVEDALMKQYDVEISTLTDIVRVLLPMAGHMKSALTNKWYHSFSITEKDGQALSLVKCDLNPKDQCNYSRKP